MIPELKGYAFFYFVCEGTNEEHILHWMDEEQALCIEKDCYSLEFCRCRSKKGRQEPARQIKEMDYDGPVAVIYRKRRKTPSFSYGDIRRVLRICVSN